MRYLIAIIGLISFCSADAQVIRAEPFYVFPEDITASPPADCLLDTYTSAAVAYSLRRLDKDYTGNAIKIRRKSDGTEHAIGFLSDGHLDTVSLKTIAGTGATDTAWVVEWYDQSGNLDTAKQSTATRQPVILTSGVIRRTSGNPAMLFDGGDFLAATSATIETYIIVMLVTRYGNTGNRFFMEHSAQANLNDGFYFNGSNNNSWFSRRTASHYAAGTLNWQPVNTHIIANHVYNSTDQKYWINDTQQTNGTITGTLRSNSAVTTSFNIMARANNTLNFTGTVQELVVWNRTATTDRSGMLTNLNNFYGIY